MEKKETLKQLLLEEINKTQGYISKGQLHLFAENQGYSPEGAGRLLRIMAGYGYKNHPEHIPEIDVDYYVGKRKQKLARYARLGEQPPVPQKPRVELVEVDGIMMARLLTTN